MTHSIKPRDKRYVKGYEFLSFAKSTAWRLGDKYKKMNTATKTRLDGAKTASKRVEKNNNNKNN